MLLRSLLRLLLLLTSLGPAAPSCTAGEFSDYSHENVAWTAGVNVNSTTPGFLSKTSPLCDCHTDCEADAGAISTQAIASSSATPQGVRFKCGGPGERKVVGLGNTDTNGHYNDINFALECSGDEGSLNVRESGSYRMTNGSWSAADVFEVRVTGTTVEYVKNGAVFHTSASPATFPLHVDTSLSCVGSMITDAAMYSGSMSSQTCSACPAGKFGPESGENIQCTMCPTGKFSSSSRSSECATCESGTFAETGATNCTNCPAGQYPAPASVPVEWTGAVGADVSTAGTITNTAAADGWASGAISAQEISSSSTEAQGVKFKFNPGGGVSRDLFVGLANRDNHSVDISEPYQYGSLDFALGCLSNENDNWYSIREAGVFKGNFHGADPTDLLEIRVTGTAVEYRKNDVVFYTSSIIPATFPLKVDTLLYAVGAGVSDVTLTAVPTSPCATCPAGQYYAAASVSPCISACVDNLEWTNYGLISAPETLAGCEYTASTMNCGAHTGFSLSGGEQTARHGCPVSCEQPCTATGPLCPQGKYAVPPPSPVTCTACPVGKYQSSVGQAFCSETAGNVFASGRNNYGQFGDGSTTSSTTPVASSLEGVVGVSAGYEHTLFRLSNGSAYGAGRNYRGQLGNNAQHPRPDQPTPQPVLTVYGVAETAAGRQHSLFLLSIGFVYATGFNDFGQLGDGSNSLRAMPNFIAINEMPLGDGVTAIKCGKTHSLFITVSGTVYGTGSNSHGELGDGMDHSHCSLCCNF
jgi:hypothetical protein